MVQSDTVFTWTKVDCTADKIFLSKHSVYSITKSLATFLKIIFISKLLQTQGKKIIQTTYLFGLTLGKKNKSKKSFN